MPSINTRPSTRKFNSLVLGDSTSNSSRTIVIGTSNHLGTKCEGSIVAGNNNIVFNNNFTQNSFVQGNNNQFFAPSFGSFVFGDNNVIGSATTTSLSAETSVEVISISGVTLLGVSNYTATTSNTVYVPNLQFTSSAATINGQSISNIISGSTLFAVGSGNYSIKAVNDVSNIASGEYSVSLGDGTVASGYASFAANANSVASGDYSAVFGLSISGSADNTVYVPNFVMKPTQAIPENSSDPVGEIGQITCDGLYFYFKAASGWLRVAGSTF